MSTSPSMDPRDELAELVATGVVRPPRTAYRTATERLTLAPGTSSIDLIDRDDRL